MTGGGVEMCPEGFWTGGRIEIFILYSILQIFVMFVNYLK